MNPNHKARNQTMKSSSFIAFAALLATPLLTQCLVVDENGNAVTTPSSSSTPNVSGSAAESQAVFDLGVQKGLSDGRGGLSRSYQRYNGSFPAAESDAFSMGYEKGYNQGIR
jgi:hypothetical protein